MSDTYTRKADGILDRTQNPTQRIIIMYMRIDKSYDEIMGDLFRNDIDSHDGRHLAWRNLKDRYPGFFAEYQLRQAYRLRQHGISSGMTFIPTPLIKSGVLLSPGPQVNWRPSHQTQKGPSYMGGIGESIVQTRTANVRDLNDVLDPNSGATTSQNISSANIAGSGFSNWRAAGFANLQ